MKRYTLLLLERTISETFRNWYADIIDDHSRRLSIHSHRKKKKKLYHLLPVVQSRRNTPYTRRENYAEESDFYYRIDDLKRGISRDYLQPRFETGSGTIISRKWNTDRRWRFGRVPRDPRRFRARRCRDLARYAPLSRKRGKSDRSTAARADNGPNTAHFRQIGVAI